jgi:hypothetical protein
MLMVTNYNEANSGHSNSLEVGNQFEDFVCIELAKRGIILQNIHSKKFQYNTGENLQGFEIKLDNRCTGCNNTAPTNQLSIEIAEKTKKENKDFVPSGIYRSDNSWLYIQGNYDVFWIFSKKMLKGLHKSNKYNEHKLDTIVKFYLPIEDADKYCANKIIINGH